MGDFLANELEGDERVVVGRADVAAERIPTFVKTMESPVGLVFGPKMVSEEPVETKSPRQHRCDVDACLTVVPDGFSRPEPTVEGVEFLDEP